MLFWHLLGRENAHIRPSMLRFCRLRPASTDAAEREQRGLHTMPSREEETPPLWWGKIAIVIQFF